MYRNGDGFGSGFAETARTVGSAILQRLAGLFELTACVLISVGCFLIAPAVGFIASGILLLLFSLAISLNARMNAGTTAADNN